MTLLIHHIQGKAPVLRIISQEKEDSMSYSGTLFFILFKRKDKKIMKLGGYKREDALRRVQGWEIIT